MSERLRHLLIPKEFRVWCRPDNVPGDFDLTILPSRCTCANCLTKYRASTQKRYKPFRVTHTGRELEPDPFADWKNKPNENLK